MSPSPDHTLISMLLEFHLSDFQLINLAYSSKFSLDSASSSSPSSVQDNIGLQDSFQDQQDL